MKRKKLPVDSVFNKFEDEDSDEVPRKRKLVPLDYSEDEKGASKGNVNTEEKRKHIKNLIEKIPTAKPELFAYPLDWSIVDTVRFSTCICERFTNKNNCNKSLFPISWNCGQK